MRVVAESLLPPSLVCTDDRDTLDFEREDLAEGTGCSAVPEERWDETTKPMSMDPLNCWSMPRAHRRLRQLEALRLRLYRAYLSGAVERYRIERIMPYIEARLG